jgi:hypothetical protein
MIDDAEMHAARMGMSFPRKIFERVVDELNSRIPLQVEAYQKVSMFQEDPFFSDL